MWKRCLVSVCALSFLYRYLYVTPTDLKDSELVSNNFSTSERVPRELLVCQPRYRIRFVENFRNLPQDLLNKVGRVLRLHMNASYAHSSQSYKKHLSLSVSCCSRSIMSRAI